jgi:hypothetical protein
MDCRRSRRHFSFPGNTHLHLKGIFALRQYTKKKAIKPNPHLDPQDHQFPGPHAFPTLQSFLFSSLQIKSLTSAAGVCLCFHFQSRLKNPEHLKFLHVSSVYQFLK